MKQKSIINVAIVILSLLMLSLNYFYLSEASDTHEFISLLGHKRGINTIEFSPDGATIATGSDDQTARIWSSDGGFQKILHGHQSRITCLAYSPDSKVLVTGSGDGQIRLWDIESGIEKKTLLGHHKEGLTDVDFNFNGNLIVSTAWDNTLQIWNAETGQSLKKIKLEQLLECLKCHPAKDIVFAGGKDGYVCAMDLNSGSMLGVFEGHEKTVKGLDISEDGHTLVTASQDKTIGIWDIESRKLHTFLKDHHGEVMDVALSSDRNQIISASKNGTVMTHDLLTREVSSKIPKCLESARCLTYSSVESRWAVGGYKALALIESR